MLALAGGMALADNLLCQIGIPCNGTSVSDVITGTNSDDQIKGFAGKDRINDSGGMDTDTIDVQEGNSSVNNRDLVDCGKGKKDRVFYDTGSNGDKIAGCEIKNP